MNFLKPIISNPLALGAFVLVLFIAYKVMILLWRYMNRNYHTMVSRRERYATSEWDLRIKKLTKTLALIIVVVGLILLIGYGLIIDYIVN